MKALRYPFTRLRIAPSMRCNFNCDYCTHFVYQKDIQEKTVWDEVEPEVWIKHINRIDPDRELVVIIGTGESTLYRGLHKIINSINHDTFLYTNLSDSTFRELDQIKSRKSLALYISYHPAGMTVENFIKNANRIKGKFNIVDFHSVPVPGREEALEKDKKIIEAAGLPLNIDHPYTGYTDGELSYYEGYGGDQRKFKDRFAARNGGKTRKVLCKTSLNHRADNGTMGYPIAPNGDIYTCWRYFLAGSKDGILGNFFDEEFQFKDEYFKCDKYGDCNICARDRNIFDVETGRQLDSDVINRVYLIGTKDQPRDTVSVCMIVKNEEKVLGDALKSISEMADEIVLVDTGSTDKTLEIAQNFAENGYKGNMIIDHFEWIDDFSAARNYAMSRATKDWIFTLDADERVDIEEVRFLGRFLSSVGGDLIACELHSVYGEDMVSRSSGSQLRIFRRSYNPLYEGRIHNKPVVRGGTSIHRIPLRINHLGYDLSPEKMKEKETRRVQMCADAVDASPNDPGVYWNYARALKVADGKFNKADMPQMVNTLKKTLLLLEGKDDYNDIYVQSLAYLAWIYHYDQQHEKAVEYGKKALEIKSDYLDAILVVGMAYAFGISGARAGPWLEMYLVEQEKYDPTAQFDGIIMEHANDRAVVYNVLSELEKIKDKNKGLKYGMDIQKSKEM